MTQTAFASSPACVKPSPSRHRTLYLADLDLLCEEQRLWHGSFESEGGEGGEGSLVEALHTALHEALTDKQREVVELYFFEGYSQHEIARRLGVCQQVVQKRLFGVQRGSRRIGGALSKLRQALLPVWESQSQRCSSRCR